VRGKIPINDPEGVVFFRNGALKIYTNCVKSGFVDSEFLDQLVVQVFGSNKGLLFGGGIGWIEIQRSES
jgi:hypothetical protein